MGSECKKKRYLLWPISVWFGWRVWPTAFLLLYLNCGKVSLDALLRVERTVECTVLEGIPTALQDRAVGFLQLLQHLKPRMVDSVFHLLSYPRFFCLSIFSSFSSYCYLFLCFPVFLHIPNVYIIQSVVVINQRIIKDKFVTSWINQNNVPAHVRTYHASSKLCIEVCSFASHQSLFHPNVSP